MTRYAHRLRAVVAICLAAPFVLLAAPASAAPSEPKVSKVFELPCSAAVCQSGEDTAASDGALVDDSIQIHVTASSAIGLTSIELQARQVLNEDPGSWVCLKTWGGSGSTFTDYYNWNTNNWPGDSGDPPSGCDTSAYHGDMTRNTSYQLRVIARDSTGSTPSDPPFDLKVSNGAATPEWISEPSVEGAEERNPIVELRWQANNEPDVREYHFIREGPDGEHEFAVSATKPGGQGCDLDGDTYVCYDDSFSSEGFGGTYSYSLIAMRTSPSSRQSCSLPPYGDCVESGQSDSMSLAIKEPPAPGPDASRDPPRWERPASENTSGASPGPAQVHRSDGSAPSSSGGSAADFFTGEFDRELPYDAPQGFDLPGGEGTTPVAIGPEGELVFDTDTSGRRRAMNVLALGLLLLVVAAHLARLLRAPVDAP